MQCVSTSPIFTLKINALQESWIETEVFTHKSEDERVFIGNDVWIGSHVLVKGGVHIGMVLALLQEQWLSRMFPRTL